MKQKLIAMLSRTRNSAHLIRALVGAYVAYSCGRVTVAYFTTVRWVLRNVKKLFIICKDTKFQSNSQLNLFCPDASYVVYHLQRYKISKQFTTRWSSNWLLL